MRINNKQSLYESFMNDLSNSKTLEGENVDKFLRKYNSIYNDLPIIKNGKLYVDNIRLIGSGISKGIEATLENGLMEVYNEEWGFTYNGSTVSDVEDMSQYWFYDDYENNEEFRNKIDNAARALYKDLNELVKSSLTESDEIDHFIQRGDVYVPVRKGQTDKAALDNLERLGGMNDVPPSEEELASGKYKFVTKYVYSNGRGGLMTGEYEKVDDEELNETTNKELEQRKDNLYNDIRQSLKDNGDKEWENIVGYKSRLPKELVDKFNKADRELWCIEMIHSILIYSSERNPDVIIEDKYLKKYIDELGRDKVMELLNQEIEEFNNATITKDTYTDSEGVTYNSVTFKDDLTEEDNNDATDINWLFTDYQYPPDLSTYEDFRNSGDSSYFTVVKSVHDAERFNYHSDYWGSADGYQEDAVDIMSTLESLVGKKVIVDIDEGESSVFKLVGLAIDRQYNSVSHMKVLVEEIGTESSMNEAVNHDNDEINSLIAKALSGPGSLQKVQKDLEKYKIKGYTDEYNYVTLTGPNGKKLISDRTENSDGRTSRTISTSGSSNSIYGVNRDKKVADGTFDYYNFLTKPKNEYQNKKNIADYWGNNGSYNDEGSPDTENLNKRVRKYLDVKNDLDTNDFLAKDYEKDYKRSLEDTERYKKNAQEYRDKAKQNRKDIRKLHSKNFKDFDSIKTDTDED